MKKRLMAALIACVLALTLTGCQTSKLSTNPLVAKWVMRYNDGNSQLLFDFDDIGYLYVVVWHHSDETGQLEQAEDYAGDYTVDAENGVITYVLGEESYTFGYTLEPQSRLTLTFGDRTLELSYVETNEAAD